MRRPKLVDYSDSECESGECIASPDEQPIPPEPQDENELAQIVIQLQHQYTKEVGDLERRQEEAEQQLELWKAQVEDRLQLQVNVMASIIKATVSGIDEAHEAILQPPTRAQAAPFNPYDDPKYFSTLTVVDEDGTRRPIFQFHRHPATVEEQWAEFRHGLHGQPPVERLEALYRAKWRNSTYGRSWFTRRKAFWDKMKEMLAEGRTEGQALEAMRRLAEGGGVPSLIAQLCKERGHGSRPDRRRDRRRLPGRKRGLGGGWDEEEDVDSGPESDECSGTGRSSPLRLRKRIRVSVAEMQEEDEEGLADGTDEDYDGL
ncbi:transcriptional activator of glycolytic enzymes-domain-containing protein [Colletotrichum cereale]|nr:transcriptional activator of glycolytic enzymes-domain-containing protein [Colletotrichum cereale]